MPEASKDKQEDGGSTKKKDGESGGAGAGADGKDGGGDGEVQLKDVETYHAHDVLCGRGGGTNNHIGNENWRNLIAANKRLYISLPKRQKMLVAQSIVKAVRSQNPPGRFLQKNSKTGKYNDIGDTKAQDKTSQALREGAPDIREEMREERRANMNVNTTTMMIGHQATNPAAVACHPGVGAPPFYPGAGAGGGVVVPQPGAAAQYGGAAMSGSYGAAYNMTSAPGFSQDPITAGNVMPMGTPGLPPNSYATMSSAATVATNTTMMQQQQQHLPTHFSSPAAASIGPQQQQQQPMLSQVMQQQQQQLPTMNQEQNGPTAYRPPQHSPPPGPLGQHSPSFAGRGGGIIMPPSSMQQRPSPSPSQPQQGIDESCSSAGRDGGDNSRTKKQRGGGGGGGARSSSSTSAGGTYDNSSTSTKRGHDDDDVDDGRDDDGRDLISGGRFLPENPLEGNVQAKLMADDWDTSPLDVHHPSPTTANDAPKVGVSVDVHSRNGEEEKKTNGGSSANGVPDNGGVGHTDNAAADDDDGGNDFEPTPLPTNFNYATAMGGGGKGGSSSSDHPFMAPPAPRRPTFDLFGPDSASLRDLLIENTSAIEEDEDNLLTGGGLYPVANVDNGVPPAGSAVAGVGGGGATSGGPSQQPGGGAGGGGGANSKSLIDMSDDEDDTEAEAHAQFHANLAQFDQLKKMLAPHNRPPPGAMMEVSPHTAPSAAAAVPAGAPPAPNLARDLSLGGFDFDDMSLASMALSRGNTQDLARFLIDRGVTGTGAPAGGGLTTTTTNVDGMEMTSLSRDLSLAMSDMSLSRGVSQNADRIREKMEMDFLNRGTSLALSDFGRGTSLAMSDIAGFDIEENGGGKNSKAAASHQASAARGGESG